MRLRVDLRDMAVGELDKAVSSFSDSVLFMLTAWQWSAWKQVNRVSSSRLIVMVPDFLYYARLVSTGQAKEIIRLPGSVAKVIGSGVNCIPTGLSEFPRLARGEFWAGAEALLAYDLGLLEREFDGEVILHYNLSDFAWLFEKERFIKSFQSKTKRRSGWGIATQQISKALSCCSRWNAIPGRILYSPGYSRPERLLISTAIVNQFGNTNWSLDLTQWPLELLSAPEIHNMDLDSDEEWLLSYPAAVDLCQGT